MPLLDCLADPGRPLLSCTALLCPPRSAIFLGLSASGNFMGTVEEMK